MGSSFAIIPHGFLRRCFFGTGRLSHGSECIHRLCKTALSHIFRIQSTNIFIRYSDLFKYGLRSLPCLYLRTKHYTHRFIDFDRNFPLVGNPAKPVENRIKQPKHNITYSTLRFDFLQTEEKPVLSRHRLRNSSVIIFEMRLKRHFPQAGA